MRLVGTSKGSDAIGWDAGPAQGNQNQNQKTKKPKNQKTKKPKNQKTKKTRRAVHLTTNGRSCVTVPPYVRVTVVLTTYRHRAFIPS